MTTVMESKQLLENQQSWEQIKESLLDGLHGKSYQNTNVILENTKKEVSILMENAVAGSTGAGNIAMLPKIILPVIRRVAPTVIANEILGVQPMNGPLGYIASLRMKYAETVGSPDPVVAGEEAFNPLDIAKFYSGNENSDNPAGAQTSQLEGTGGRRMSLGLVTQAVEAKTRKLQAEWTFEGQQDAMSQYGIDIEAELMSMLAQEITAEIDQELLFKLRALPGAPAVTYDQSAVSGVSTYVGDEHAALATLILEQSNLIAQRTRRAPGNWVVVTPQTLTVLQSATSSALARTTEGEFDGPSNVRYVGRMNDTMNVYVDSYATADTPVLVGYKGSDTDAAAIYSPYVPLMSTPVVIDPNTFTPTVSFLSRYAYTQFDNTADSLGNSADYLGKIGINANNLRFQ